MVDFRPAPRRARMAVPIPLSVERFDGGSCASEVLDRRSPATAHRQHLLKLNQLHQHADDVTMNEDEHQRTFFSDTPVIVSSAQTLAKQLSVNSPRAGGDDHHVEAGDTLVAVTGSSVGGGLIGARTQGQAAPLSNDDGFLKRQVDHLLAELFTRNAELANLQRAQEQQRAVEQKTTTGPRAAASATSSRSKHPDEVDEEVIAVEDEMKDAENDVNSAPTRSEVARTSPSGSKIRDNPFLLKQEIQVMTSNLSAVNAEKKILEDRVRELELEMEANALKNDRRLLDAERKLAESESELQQSLKAAAADETEKLKAVREAGEKKELDLKEESLALGEKVRFLESEMSWLAKRRDALEEERAEYHAKYLEASEAAERAEKRCEELLVQHGEELTKLEQIRLMDLTVFEKQLATLAERKEKQQKEDAEKDSLNTVTLDEMGENNRISGRTKEGVMKGKKKSGLVHSLEFEQIGRGKPAAPAARNSDPASLGEGGKTTSGSGDLVLVDATGAALPSTTTAVGAQAGSPDSVVIENDNTNSASSCEDSESETRESVRFSLDPDTGCLVAKGSKSAKVISSGFTTWQPRSTAVAARPSDQSLAPVPVVVPPRIKTGLENPTEFDLIGTAPVKFKKAIEPNPTSDPAVATGEPKIGRPDLYFYTEKSEEAAVGTVAAGALTGIKGHAAAGSVVAPSSKQTASAASQTVSEVEDMLSTFEKFKQSFQTFKKTAGGDAVAGGAAPEAVPTQMRTVATGTSARASQEMNFRFSTELPSTSDLKFLPPASAGEVVEPPLQQPADRSGRQKQHSLPREPKNQHHTWSLDSNNNRVYYGADTPPLGGTSSNSVAKQKLQFLLAEEESSGEETLLPGRRGGATSSSSSGRAAVKTSPPTGGTEGAAPASTTSGGRRGDKKTAALHQQKASPPRAATRTPAQQEVGGSLTKNKSPSPTLSLSSHQAAGKKKKKSSPSPPLHKRDFASSSCITGNKKDSTEVPVAAAAVHQHPASRTTSSGSTNQERIRLLRLELEQDIDRIRNESLNCSNVQSLMREIDHDIEKLRKQDQHQVGEDQNRHLRGTSTGREPTTGTARIAAAAPRTMTSARTPVNKYDSSSHLEDLSSINASTDGAASPSETEQELHLGGGGGQGRAAKLNRIEALERELDRILK